MDKRAKAEAKRERKALRKQQKDAGITPEPSVYDSSESDVGTDNNTEDTASQET